MGDAFYKDGVIFLLSGVFEVRGKRERAKGMLFMDVVRNRLGESCGTLAGCVPFADRGLHAAIGANHMLGIPFSLVCTFFGLSGEIQDSLVTATELYLT